MRGVLAAVALALALVGCGERAHRGVWYLRWHEAPGARSLSCDPATRVAFQHAIAYDRQAEKGAADWSTVRASLREGDVIAYRKTRWEADKAVLTGHVNALPYRLFRYGHLGMLVQTPQGLRLLSSQGFVGPNLDEDLETLRCQRWDAYRLDRWAEVDAARVREFAELVVAKGQRRTGYDFSGMFGLINAELRPDTPEKIGPEYICSTVVVAALYYAGIELDAIRSRTGDLVTPNQVVAGGGRFVTRPAAVELEDRELAP